MPGDWRNMPDIRKMLEGFLGGSKIVLMDLEQNVTILNKAYGHTVDGRWYSNRSYATYKYTGKSAYGREWDYDGYYGLGKPFTKAKDKEVSEETIVVDGDEDYRAWFKAQNDRQDESKQLALIPAEVLSEIVPKDDPLFEYYPHGFEYQGYEMCSVCVPMDIVGDALTVPLFVEHQEDYFVCESCNVWVSPSSPKRYTVPFDLDTELPMYDALDWEGPKVKEEVDA